MSFLILDTSLLLYFMTDTPKAAIIKTRHIQTLVVTTSITFEDVSDLSVGFRTVCTEFNRNGGLFVGLCCVVSTSAGTMVAVVCVISC
jgi:hypothetical protein